MSGQAHIGSIDDLARFRAHLLTFRADARAAVEECAADVVRQQLWIDADRRRHWEGELWRRQRKLEEAKQSLFQESLSSSHGPTSFHQLQVHRAERVFEEAREKLQKTKAWSRNFENRSLPMVKQVEALQSVLTVDLAKALQFLNQTLESLDAYAGRMASGPKPAANGPAADSQAEAGPGSEPAPATPLENP